MSATVFIMLIAIVIATGLAWHGRGRCTDDAEFLKGFWRCVVSELKRTTPLLSADGRA
jgi:hypothetical protein